LLYRKQRFYKAKNFDYIAVQNFLKSYVFQKLLHGNIIKVFCFIGALFPIKQKRASQGIEALF
jgi:hypothetical protein